MAKKQQVSKGIQYLGMGIFAVMGFILGLVLFGIFYSWYLLGFADSTTVFITALFVIIVIYILYYIAYQLGKKYGLAYQKAIYLGIGFTIAMIIVAFILSSLNIESDTSVTVGSFTIGSWL